MRSLLLLVSFIISSFASSSLKGQERIDNYVKLAKPLGSIDLTFPGPGGGYAFANLDVQRVSEFGDTTYVKKPYLIDFTVSSDGTFIPADSSRSTEQYVEHVIRLGKERFARATMSPSESKVEFRELDTNFAGVLGYFFFRKYISVFDFKRNKLTLYPHFASINIRESDTNVIQIDYKDDAIITYCKCPFPSAWLETKAPPLKEGRVFFGFGTPVSEVYMPSLDVKTKGLFEKETELDPLTGKKKTPGFSLAQFRVGDRNIAKQSPRRIVKDLPPLFKDLNISVMGSIGTDVMRSFSAMIFDPSRANVTLVK